LSAVQEVDWVMISC